MNRFADTQYFILEMAVEDSYGLWELLGRARSLSPHSSDNDLLPALRGALKDLLDRGWIQLSSVKYPDGEEEAISPDQVWSVLLLEGNWAGPTLDGTQYRVYATTTGEKAYMSGER